MIFSTLVMEGEKTEIALFSIFRFIQMFRIGLFSLLEVGGRNAGREFGLSGQKWFWK